MALRELIEAKQEHRKPRAIEEAPPASNVINLMDALKRSVKGGGAANDDAPAGRGRKSSARRANTTASAISRAPESRKASGKSPAKKPASSSPI